MEEPLKLIIFGRQGSGKGTQCGYLLEKLGLVHLSTGDILRDNIERGTELGKLVEPILASGQLVDDETILKLVDSKLSEPEIQATGFILDGFPRTLAQAQGLLEFVGPDGIDLAINLEVSVEECIERMMSRGRQDDEIEAVKKRLDLYESETVPAIKFYESLGMVVNVAGLGTEAEVSERVIAKLNS